MALLGVLLGMIIGLMVGAIVALALLGNKRSVQLAARVNDCDATIHNMLERISALERRKAVVAEAVAAAPKPANVRRQWSEDTPARDAN